MEEKGVQVTNFPKVDIHFDPWVSGNL
jgi:hypothetical protein